MVRSDIPMDYQYTDAGGFFIFKAGVGVCPLCTPYVLYFFQIHVCMSPKLIKKILVGARFFAQVQTGPEAHPASCTVGTGSIPGVKWPERDADHSPPSSAEVAKR
jgi:hypothetical protein